MDLEAAIIRESAKELGIDFLKEKQREVAKAVLSGYDTFVSLPTGYGKSIILLLICTKVLCDCPVLAMKTHTNCCIIGTSSSIVVSISPLISLSIPQKFSRLNMLVRSRQILSVRREY